MKKTILHHSDKWFGVFSGTADPPPQANVPPPVPEFGTAPPINTVFGHAATFNI